MQFAICRSTAASLGRTSDIIEQNGLHWLKFGNEYFCFAADAGRPIDWREVEKPGLKLSLGAPGQATAGSLYLVTQEGRIFQRAHPDVPVLFDKGRHLVVSLDGSRADEIVQHEARFSIRPATRSEVIFEALSRPSVPFRMDDRIKVIVDAISRTSFRSTLTELASFPTRHSLTSHYQNAAKLIQDRLRAMGYLVSRQEVPIPGGSTLNVIADKTGIGSVPRSLTLVTAHLDSVNHPADHSQPDDPTAPAPGADDNGSGSAGVVEIARVLKDQPITQDLRLILFGGEEQRLLGSKHYVDQLPNTERARIRSVVNMDMIAVDNTGRPSVLLEGGDPVSKDMIAGLSLAANTYTQLTVDVSLHPWGSDHCPFIDANVPAVLTIEGNDDENHNIHTANDALDHINFDLAQQILRMNAAFVSVEIGLQASVTA